MKLYSVARGEVNERRMLWLEVIIVIFFAIDIVILLPGQRQGASGALRAEIQPRQPALSSRLSSGGLIEELPFSIWRFHCHDCYS